MCRRWSICSISLEPGELERVGSVLTAVTGGLGRGTGRGDGECPETLWVRLSSEAFVIWRQMVDVTTLSVRSTLDLRSFKVADAMPKMFLRRYLEGGGLTACCWGG